MSFSLSIADVERITGAVFIDGPVGGRASSRFWVLLLLAAIIASAGVVEDSTATVIGAMIVAPLMTPILGTALSIVLADRSHLARSMTLVIGGALVVIAIGFLFGLVDSPTDRYLGDSQVSARISPRLIDLIAALATGTVGAFALVRADISDTLPGVAIAISLVPPLVVVGLMLAVGRLGDAGQAILLFGTNVAAIIATGTVVLLLYGIRSAALEAGAHVGPIGQRSFVPVAILLVLVAIPLALGSAAIARDEQLAAQARPVAQSWAQVAGWQVSAIEAVNNSIVVTAIGPPPEVDTASLRQQLNAAGMASSDLTIRLIVGGSQICPAGGSTCLPANS